MTAMPLPAWRSLMFVPATGERFVAKAHTRGADGIILDLEDSIPLPEKQAARDALAKAAETVGQAGADVLVRVNRPLDLCIPDITAAVMPKVKALMLPKVMGPEHIKLLSEVVAVREAAMGMAVGSTRFIALVETPDAIPHLHAIAGADPRMAAMSIGVEDLAMEIEAQPGADMLYHYGMANVTACRAARILPLGSIGPFADFNDLEGYRAGLRRSRRLGFAVAACIHPTQVPIVNEEYGVSAEEADRAHRLIAAFDAAVAEGKAAVAFEGAMVDIPVVERAKRLIARARR